MEISRMEVFILIFISLYNYRVTRNEQSSMRTHFINESVEAGLVVANNWDDETPSEAAPKKGLLFIHSHLIIQSFNMVIVN